MGEDEKSDSENSDEENDVDEEGEDEKSDEENDVDEEGEDEKSDSENSDEENTEDECADDEYFDDEDAQSTKEVKINGVLITEENKAMADEEYANVDLNSCF